jgi:hypothetical protein
MKRTVYWGFSLMLAAALAAHGQESQWKSEAEYKGYTAAYEEKDNAKKAALAEKFLADFKDSFMRTQAYTMMLLANANAGQAGVAGAWAKAMDSAERVKEFVPNPDAALTTTVNTVGFYAGQGLKNNVKTLDYGKRLLGGNPNNLEVLIAISSIMSSSFPGDAAARDKHIDEAMDITKRALAQPKPAAVNDQQWRQIQVQLNLTTCALYYNKRLYPETLTACAAVLKLDGKDARAWYYTGLALKFQVPELDKRYRAALQEYNDNRTADAITVADYKSRLDATLKVRDDKLDEAIDAFAASVATGGVPEARTELETLYKGKNSGSLDGLDAIIAAKKAQLGD